MAEAVIKVNLGCGERFHPDWTNIDITAHGPGVIQHDLSRGIPLADASCDVVYHAAVLEHMRRPDAVVFLAECSRVLKPGGVIRVGVPDLERICRLYFDTLASALNGEEAAGRDYDWMMLEFYDQTVREVSGGGMLDYLRQNPLPNEGFVYERIGEEGRQLVKAIRRSAAGDGPGDHSIRSFLRGLWKRSRSAPSSIRRRMLQAVLSETDRRALEIGRFRLAGEVHQWMYDRYSLARVLGQAGFSELQVRGASTSRIADWSSYNLDTLPDGQAIKPDLMFMEGVRPKPSGGGHSA